MSKKQNTSAACLYCAGIVTFYRYFLESSGLKWYCSWILARIVCCGISRFFRIETVSRMSSALPSAMPSLFIGFASYSRTLPPITALTPSRTASCFAAICSSTLPDMSVIVHFTYSLMAPFSASSSSLFLICPYCACRSFSSAASFSYSPNRYINISYRLAQPEKIKGQEQHLFCLAAILPAGLLVCFHSCYIFRCLPVGNLCSLFFCCDGIYVHKNPCHIHTAKKGQDRVAGGFF